jgi:hypothetical protein
MLAAVRVISDGASSFSEVVGLPRLSETMRLWRPVGKSTNNS